MPFQMSKVRPKKLTHHQRYVELVVVVVSNRPGPMDVAKVVTVLTWSPDLVTSTSPAALNANRIVAGGIT